MFESEKDPDIASASYAIDMVRLGTQNEFMKRYKKLSNEKFSKITSSYGNMENAFQHAYASAYIAYNHNEEIARWLGYQKEIITEQQEKKSNGKENAALDTNRDLWNNEVGIKYANEGKTQGKSFEEIADEIFENIQKEDSDFIVNFKTDKRRWNPDIPLNKIWDKVHEEHKSLSRKYYNMFVQNIKNILNKIKADNFTNFSSKSFMSDVKKGIELMFKGFDEGNLGDSKGTRYKYGFKDENNEVKLKFDIKAMLDGFNEGKIANNSKPNWAKKFNVGNSDTDKGRWVTMPNGKHLFIKDK